MRSPEQATRWETATSGRLWAELRAKGYTWEFPRGVMPPGILANLEAPRRPQGNWCDRFRFSQLLMIANSLCDTGEYDDLWTSIHKLNVLRNRLSHEPDQSRFDQALQDLLGFHTPRFFEEHEGEHGIIHSCIVSIYSSLVHLIAETDDQH